MSKAIRRIAVLIVVLQAAHVFAQAQQYTWRNVQIFGGGFIPGIVFNETEPNLVYTRTGIGGAYRLDPATNRWVPLLDSIGWDDWNLTGVISIANKSYDGRPRSAAPTVLPNRTRLSNVRESHQLYGRHFVAARATLQQLRREGT